MCDKLAQALREFLAANDTEGFGCACSPTQMCGPCRWRTAHAPLRAALAEHDATPQPAGDLQEFEAWWLAECKRLGVTPVNDPRRWALAGWQARAERKP